MHKTATFLFACACVAQAYKKSYFENVGLPGVFFATMPDWEDAGMGMSPVNQPWPDTDFYQGDYETPLELDPVEYIFFDQRRKYGDPNRFAQSAETHSFKPTEYFSPLCTSYSRTRKINRHINMSPNDYYNYNYNQQSDNLNLKTIIHVIHGLVVHLAEDGWESFQKEYMSLVEDLIHRVEEDPELAMYKINCFLDAAKRSIKNMFKLFTKLCRDNPAICDILTFASVKMSSADDLQQESELLTQQGKESSNYHNLFADDIHTRSRKEGCWHITSGKHIFQDLMHSSAIGRPQIFPRETGCPFWEPDFV